LGTAMKSQMGSYLPFVFRYLPHVPCFGLLF
jgi:hypothetical protein